MSKNLFITATEARSGKSAISLGIMEMLLRSIDKVAFFRPYINNDHRKDNDIDLISSYFNLNLDYEEMYAYTASDANNLIAQGKNEELVEGIFNKYKAIEQKYDFVLCEGSDFKGATSAFEFDINAEIASNLGCPVLLVANAQNKTEDEIISSIEISLESLSEKSCNVISTVINKTGTQNIDKIIKRLKKSSIISKQLIYTVEEEKYLGIPTVGEIAKNMNAKVLYGKKHLNRHVQGFSIAAMRPENLLERLAQGILVITPGDRADVLLACLVAAFSLKLPNISGVMLTGGFEPADSICRLIEGFPDVVPILSIKENTFPTAIAVDSMHSVISPDDRRKITRALELFAKNVNIDELGEKIITSDIDVITPKMFEYSLIQKARKFKQHIVLPEGTEERILKAAEILLQRNAVDITLLGDEGKIRKKISRMNLYLNGANIIEVIESSFFEDYAQTYYDLRKHKGLTKEIARDIISDTSFFGTMMIYKGHADGMVSGAVHTTADTIRPAFRIIKTVPGCSIVSSIILMCLEDRLLAYGDCAVNPDPNADELAEIAIFSAKTAMIFGIEPRVAMLSYSTGESGKGKDVDKVRKATEIAKKMVVDLPQDIKSVIKIEGPIQYDAAIDPVVAKIKMPDSEVAGRATVFIFPDLNTGNNTYKAVQRASGAVAMGPILQGLKKPVNDLSRGCSVQDIVNTVLMTALQAQAGKGLI